MSQEYPPVETSAVNKDFGLEFPGNQYDFEAQHQTASDDGSAQWNSNSGITMFTFREDWAPRTEGSDLDDVFGYGNNNVQHQHSATRRTELALEQLVAQRVPYIPDPPYQLFQEPTSFGGAQKNASDARAQDYRWCATLNPHEHTQTTEIASARGGTCELVFRSLAEAKKAMLSRHLEKAWFAPIGDSTIPTNDEERATYVAELLDAMKDTSACSDKRETPAFMSRWTPNAINAPNSTHMEKVCWQLVDVAERLHIDGPASLPIYDKLALAMARKSRYLTFGQRMSHLSALLRLSKYRCFSLLKVASPAQRCSGTIVNCVQNSKRQEFIKEGRPVWKDKNGAANKKIQSVPVNNDEYISSEVSSLDIAVGQAHTEDAHQDIPVSVHSPSPAPTTDTHHTHIFSVNHRTTSYRDSHLDEIHGDSEQGNIVTGRYEGNRHVSDSLYNASHTPRSNHAGVCYLHPGDVPSSSQALKRTARDAQLDKDSCPPAQRPRFDYLVDRSYQV
ncbi:hypothetical protein GT037_002311 [Alternaria burnsii]|uniref:Uncharacterized protein n=1 Tax=Alternaria burnsii TaxID=1187904 RepID=A0A8H7BCS5_9PLEO|nr:uncharacterized protein GT037_002311 [Alternaria burnsii]KAF7680660.1 hypothetical protein GT037_002311 [Alternaria burnsii]